MNAVIEHPLNARSVQSAWTVLNKLVPIGPIVGERDYKRRVRIMDDLLDRVGANESHPLMPVLDLVTSRVEAYEAAHVRPPVLAEATPAQVLAHLMEEHGLRQIDLSVELGGQSTVSAILAGKRELNARQVKALAQRFAVSPAAFL